MRKHPKLTGFVSEIDQDLQAFNKTHPTLSPAPQKERDKYAHIAYLRDVANRPHQIKKKGGDF